MFTVEGKIWKDGKFWLVEVPSLDIMSQGHTKAEAYEMIADAIETHVHADGFKVDVIPSTENAAVFTVSVKEPEHVSLLLGLLLKRQRAKNRLSLKDMREELGLNSRSNYAQYEKGTIMPGIPQLMSFIEAMGMQAILNLNVVRAVPARVRCKRARHHR